MELHERMKAIQTDSDMKIRALAPVMGVSERSLSNYLNGFRTVPYDVLLKFARYFNVTTDYLLGLTDDPAPAYPVSAGEREMLERFRTLGREQKELIIQNIELMRRQNER